MFGLAEIYPVSLLGVEDGGDCLALLHCVIQVGEQSAGHQAFRAVPGDRDGCGGVRAVVQAGTPEQPLESSTHTSLSRI